MSTGPELPQLPPAGPLYGAFYFGTILSTAFFGVSCMQLFYYYVHYPNDPASLKWFVGTVWTLNTVHQALSTSGTYKYIMAGLSNPLSFLNGIPDLVLELPFTVLVTLPSQGFFVYRIYLFSGRNLIAPIIWLLLALLQLVAAFIWTVKALYIGNGTLQAVQISDLNGGEFEVLITLVFAIAAGVDVLIAMFMTFLLVRTRSAINYAKTAHVLQRLIVFSVNTGIWTALFAVFTLILLHVFPTNLLYAVPGVPVCSVYCNTLLANLNARSYISGAEMTELVETDLFSNAYQTESQTTSRARSQGQKKRWSFHLQRWAPPLEPTA